MTESMGGNILLHAGHRGQFFQDEEYHHAAEWLAPPVEEEKIFGAFGSSLLLPVMLLVDTDLLDGGISDGDQSSSLLPLPTTLMNSLSRESFDCFRLITSLTRRPQLYMVSRMALLRWPLRLTEVDLCNDGFDLFIGEHFGQCLPQSWRFKQDRRIMRYDLFNNAIPEELPDACHNAGLRSSGHAQLTHPYEECLEVFQGYIGRAEDALLSSRYCVSLSTSLR